MDDSQQLEVYMPTEAATATAPDGRRLIFFTVPQFHLLIKRVLAERPAEYTYQWGYHPEHKVHVLVFGWPGLGAGGIAIPEGVGDTILHAMLGTTDVYITVEPVQKQLEGSVSPEVIQRLIMGTTIYLPEVHFKPEA